MNHLDRRVFFMKTYCEWYLTGGTVLKGEKAQEYLNLRLTHYKKLIEDIDKTLSNCLDYNHVAMEDTLPNTVMFTGESLSIIQIELELLLDRISSVIDSL